MTAALAELRSVYRTYHRGTEEVQALRDVSLTVNPGEFLVVTGPSGSGKSTLLHVMAGLDRPDSGSVLLEGSELSELHDDDLTLYRRRKLGFIFQFFHLLPTLSATENVMLPLLLDGVRPSEAEAKAIATLDRFGLAKRGSHRPREMSGGEQQRVAIARAMICDPVLLLADEPTGNLDSTAGAEVYRILAQAPASSGTAVVMVTHDPEAAEFGTRHVHLRDGLLTTVDPSTSPQVSAPTWIPPGPVN